MRRQQKMRQASDVTGNPSPSEQTPIQGADGERNDVTPRKRGDLLDYRVQVFGHSLPLIFTPGISQCGDCKDGVSFHFGEGHEFQGAWVLSYASLMEMARLATERRAALDDEVKAGHATIDAAIDAAIQKEGG